MRSKLRGFAKRDAGARKAPRRRGDKEEKSQKGVGAPASILQKSESGEIPVCSREFHGGVTTVWHCNEHFFTRKARERSFEFPKRARRFAPCLVLSFELRDLATPPHPLGIAVGAGERETIPPGGLGLNSLILLLKRAGQ